MDRVPTASVLLATGADAQAAQILVAMLNSQGGKFTIPDVMLKWGEQEEGAGVSGT